MKGKTLRETAGALFFPPTHSPSQRTSPMGLSPTLVITLALAAFASIVITLDLAAFYFVAAFFRLGYSDGLRFALLMAISPAVPPMLLYSSLTDPRYHRNILRLCCAVLGQVASFLVAARLCGVPQGPRWASVVKRMSVGAVVLMLFSVAYLLSPEAAYIILQ